MLTVILCFLAHKGLGPGWQAFSLLHPGPLGGRSGLGVFEEGDGAGAPLIRQGLRVA